MSYKDRPQTFLQEKMMTAVQSLSIKRAGADEINAVLERDGCVVLTDIISKAHHLELKAEIDQLFTKIPVCQGNFFGFATKRMSSILAKSVTSAPLVTNSRILAVMDAFLLQNCRQYQLNLTQAIQIGPGEPAQYVHTDDLMFPFELAGVGQQKMINCMWAIDAFTEENGATNLVPGSHKWPRDRRPTPEEIVPGEMAPGSVLIYFGSLLHGGGANRTKHPRTGLVISYCLGWLRQAENHYLALPRHMARSFSPELQKLLGYFVHEPNLGAVQGRDPIELLSLSGETGKRFEEFIAAEVKEMLGEYRRSASS